MHNSFLENFVDSVATVPTDLWKNFALMREMDQAVHGNIRALTEQVYKGTCDENHINAEIEKTLYLSDEKIQIAQQTYDMIDKCIRRLDDDLIALEQTLAKAKDTKPTYTPYAGKRPKAASTYLSASTSTGKAEKSPRGRVSQKTLASTSAAAAKPVSPAIEVTSDGRASPVPQSTETPIATTAAATDGTPTASAEAPHIRVTRERPTELTAASTEGPPTSRRRLTVKDGQITPVPLEPSPQPTSSTSATPTPTQTEAVTTATPTATAETTATEVVPQKRGVGPDGVRLQGDDMPVDPNEPRYCICQRVSFGQMVACDNADCPREWFHFECVGLTQAPKGKWYCPECTAQLRKKRA